MLTLRNVRKRCELENGMSCAVVFRRLSLVLAVVLCASLPASAAEALKGTALVIGQSAYARLVRLTNPERDARAIEALLDELGFATTTVLDGNAKKLRRTLDGFIEDAEGADVALVYYSGHAIEAGGVNYLIPTDADITSLAEANESLVSLQDVLDRLRGKARITILLLDACRVSPFPPDAPLKPDAASPGIAVAAAGLGAGKGAIVLNDAVSPDTIGEVIGFAAEPGKVALDGPAGSNSPYAAALLEHLGANDAYEFGQVMTMVTEEVYLATATRQRPWVNASLRRLLRFGGAVAEVSPDEQLLSGARRKLLLSIAATPKDMQKLVENLAKEQSLPLDPLYGMLKELQVDVSAGPQELDKQLRAGAENLKKLLADKPAPLRNDQELARLAGLADRAEAKGVIPLAKAFRARASARADELDKTLDQREADVIADRIELASTYADEAGTAILAADYRLAAVKYARAAEQATGKDDALVLSFRFSEADALRNQGEYKGENEALQQAAGRYEALLASIPRERKPAEWARAQSSLGIALRVLGERGLGKEKLKKAVTAFEAALAERPRDRFPLEWAVLQNNLGRALLRLSAQENDLENLQKASAALNAALTIQTRDNAPMDWAETQLNLGHVLSTLGERETGTDNLKRAALAYEAALTVRTRERAPWQWADTQNGLGLVLNALGRRETGSENLVKAVAAFEAALGEWSREEVPLEWAKAQNNLGLALSVLGWRETGTGNLLRAATAYQAALTEWTRERVPRQWANAQDGLSMVFLALGEREGKIDHLKKAIAASEASLTVLTRDDTTLGWGNAEINLGNALLALGRRERNPATISRAVEVYEAVLADAKREVAPMQWASVQNVLGNSLATLAEIGNQPENFKKAAAAYELALTEWTRERVPLDWASLQFNLALVLQNRGVREYDEALLKKAIVAYEAALSEWTQDRLPRQWADAQTGLGTALVALAGYEADNDVLRQAIARYDAALTVKTREKAPMEWAVLQYNRGTAWQFLGGRQGSSGDMLSDIEIHGFATVMKRMGERDERTRSFNEAADAFEQALREWSRERNRDQWAQTQMGLGLVRQTLAEGNGGDENWRKAATAYEAAATAWTLEKNGLNWALAKDRLGGVLLELGRRHRDGAMIGEARQAIEAAWQVYKSRSLADYDAYFTERLAGVDAAAATLAK